VTVAAKARVEATAAADVVPRVPAEMLARVAAASKLLAHRVHVVRKVKGVRVPDVDVHLSATRNPAATKVVLPVAVWVSHVLPVRHPAVSPTPCVPASI